MGEAGSRMTVGQIKAMLAKADRMCFEQLEREFFDDARKGVAIAFAAARKRIEREERECARLEGLYRFERDLAADHGASIVVGLDEVGRGPLAGPLTVGAVVLDPSTIICGLNDSKQVRPEDRPAMAQAIRETARAWSIQHIQPDEIDAAGMSASLRVAFSRAIADIERQGVIPDLVLIDGNPLGIDRREVNVVKGDATCASIAAASIIAKVQRDALMVEYARQYPHYRFDECKGYGSAAHIEAIGLHGLSPIHRKSFCRSFCSNG